MFLNAILANTAKIPYLQHILDVRAKEGTRVNIPIEHGIENKYLKTKNEKLEVYINDLKRQ